MPPWISRPSRSLHLRNFGAIVFNPSGSSTDPSNACKVSSKAQKSHHPFLESTLFISSTRSASSLLLRAHWPPSAESSSYVLHHLGSRIIHPCLFKALTPHARHAKQVNTSFHVDYRDLRQIVECVLPVGRIRPNLTSTEQSLDTRSRTNDKPQILENWRTKQIIDPQR